MMMNARPCPCVIPVSAPVWYIPWRWSLFLSALYYRWRSRCLRRSCSGFFQPDLRQNGNPVSRNSGIFRHVQIGIINEFAGPLSGTVPAVATRCLAADRYQNIVSLTAVWLRMPASFPDTGSVPDFVPLNLNPPGAPENGLYLSRAEPPIRWVSYYRGCCPPVLVFSRRYSAYPDRYAVENRSDLSGPQFPEAFLYPLPKKIVVYPVTPTPVQSGQRQRMPEKRWLSPAGAFSVY